MVIILLAQTNFAENQLFIEISRLKPQSSQSDSRGENENRDKLQQPSPLRAQTIPDYLMVIRISIFALFSGKLLSAPTG